MEDTWSRRAWVLACAMCIALWLAYLGLVPLGHWQADEYQTFGSLQDSVYDFVRWRVSSWSPRPLSEIFIYAYGRLVQATLHLAQVGVGEAGHLRELAQGQVGQLPLSADEGAEGFPLGVPGFWHQGLQGLRRPAGPAGPGYWGCSVSGELRCGTSWPRVTVTVANYSMQPCARWTRASGSTARGRVVMLLG